MPNYSKIIIVGHLTRDPEIRKAGNAEVCDLSIASNYKSKDYEEVFYAECVAWGKTIDIIDGKFFKGDAIMIEGRPKTESWEDKEGNKRSKTKITIERVIYLSSGERGGSRQPEPPREHERSRPGYEDRQESRQQPQRAQTSRRQASPPPREEVDEDNIPY